MDIRHSEVSPHCKKRKHARAELWGTPNFRVQGDEEELTKDEREQPVRKEQMRRL